ncbi:hypothetical protein EYB25_000084 [Talaromyces marneffei]|nr:hypothetical protein EYB25_000084 [Talaromyces marneffei]
MILLFECIYGYKMPAAFPPRFVSVDTGKRSQGFHNLIGVVVDCLPISRSAGSSFVTTFTIKDTDFGPGNETWKGLKIKYFNDGEHRLPVVKVNDVILLRRLRVRQFHGSLTGVVGNTDNVSWAVFRQPDGPGSLMPVCSPGSKALSVEEQTYANTLVESVIHYMSTTSATPSTRKKGHAESSSTPSESRRQVIAKPKDKFSLIKDLSARTFADLAVHVVKMFYQDDRVHLYVTDYTVNKSLFDYGDKSDEENEGGTDDTFGFLTRPTREKRAWQGPRGRMTLQVTLWDPHSYYARENVTEDGYILLRNVHIKADKMNGLLEGVMHTDKKYPEKVDVRLLEDDHQDDPRVFELKTRKREYWRQNRTNKRKLAEDFGDGDDGKPKKNSKQRRKELHRQKKQQEQRKQQQQNKSLQREEGQSEIPSTMNKSNRPNPYIQAKDPARGCRKISEILPNESHNISLPDNIQYRLPFQCVKYRSTVRVVDYFPPNIADFSVPYIPEYSSVYSSDNEDDITPETPGVRWEWRFCLLVEDAQILPGQPREQIKLFVSGSDAEFLLKLDAVNLRKNKEAFIRLQEKLCILWGDLEERKSQGMDTQQKGPSQLPFTCCIKEWGVRCACRTDVGSYHNDGSDRECAVVGPEHNRECLGWERRFALFGTTINEE